jgi:hypothetical protein
MKRRSYHFVTADRRERGAAFLGGRTRPMYNSLRQLAPLFGLAVILGVFMASDKIWLHWYAPEADVERRVVEGPLVQGPPSSTPAGGSEVSAAGESDPTSLARTRDAFAALWIVAQQTPYRVRYETSSAAGDPGDTYVIFNLPPFGRVDRFPPDAKGPSSQLLVDGEGAARRCIWTDGRPDCAAIDSLAAPFPLAASPIVFPPASTFNSYEVTETEARTIAGQLARCFHLTSGAEGVATGDADYCFSFSDAPVPLFARGAFGVVEASELSSAVAPSDFVELTRPPGEADNTITFTTVAGDAPGGTARVSVLTRPGVSCSIAFVTPAGAPSLDQGLVAKVADSSGAISWSWRIGSRSRSGVGVVTVTCGGSQAHADVPVG